MCSDGDQRRIGKPDRDLILSAVLKALRAHRRMASWEVAESMGMDLRSYQRFEAGEGYLKVERIFRFATVIDADPYALLASVKLGTPELAVACSDNKFVMLLVAHVHELHDQMGAELRNLQPQLIVETMGAAFSCLKAGLEGDCD